jgi:hypothetical protein
MESRTLKKGNQKISWVHSSILETIVVTRMVLSKKIKVSTKINSRDTFKTIVEMISHNPSNKALELESYENGDFIDAILVHQRVCEGYDPRNVNYRLIMASEKAKVIEN